MDSQNIYESAVRLMEQISAADPAMTASPDAAFCMLITQQQHVYAGISSLHVTDGELHPAHPEFNAIMTMVAAGESMVRQMISISFATGQIVQPCSDCLALLQRFGPANAAAEIFVAADRSVTAVQLAASVQQEEATAPAAEEQDISAFAAEEFAEPAAEEQDISAFAFPAGEDNPFAFRTNVSALAAGSPAARPAAKPERPVQPIKEYADHVEADTDNPFYEPPIDPAAQEPPPHLPDPQSTQLRYMFDQVQHPSSGQPVQQSAYISQPLPVQQSVSQQSVQQPLYTNQQPVQPASYVNQSLHTTSNVTANPPVRSTEPVAAMSKAEMRRAAKEKKKLAKINADFQKQMKKKGL